MIRLKEHVVDVHHERIKKSAIVEHCYNTKHYMCFENAEVLASIPHYYKRRIREALEIKKFMYNLNSDYGLNLKEYWIPILHVIRYKHNSHIINESKNPIH